MKIDNYHDKSKKIEQELEDELLVLFGILLGWLADLHPLTEQKIFETVERWKVINWPIINKLNQEQVSEVSSFVNKIMPATQSQIISNVKAPFSASSSQKIEQYTKAANKLTDGIVSFVQDRFIELSVLEQNYTINSNLINEYISEIVNTTENKVNLFATMNTISNMRQFLFGNAYDNSYTEYLWRTQRDNKVRPSHAYMDDKWVRFDSPPKETRYCHVAQDYNCRCFAAHFR